MILKLKFFNNIYFSLFLLTIISFVSQGLGIETIEDLNKRLPIGFHHYKIHYVVLEENNKGDLIGSPKELILLGCYHSMPFEFLPGPQRDVLNNLNNNKVTIASECSIFYHTKKLKNYINLLIGLKDHSKLLESGYFLEYERKFNRKKLEQIHDCFVDYFTTIIQSIQESENYFFDEFDLEELSLYKDVKLASKLPSKLIYDFLNCYIMHTSGEYHLLRSHQKQERGAPLNLDNHDAFFETEENLFKAAESAIHLLSDKPLVDKTLQFYSNMSWIFNKEGCPNKQLTRLLDFCCCLSGDDDKILTNTIISRMIMERKINRRSHGNIIKPLLSEIMNFQDGYLDRIDARSYASLQERNFSWLRTGVKQSCLLNSSVALILFGARHLGGLATDNNYKGILDFFIDLSENKNKAYWISNLGEENFDEWISMVKISKIERLNHKGDYIACGG